MKHGGDRYGQKTRPSPEGPSKGQPSKVPEPLVHGRRAGAGKSDIPQENIPHGVPQENAVQMPISKDLGLDRKQVYEARLVRDLEKNDPGATDRIQAAILSIKRSCAGS